MFPSHLQKLLGNSPRFQGRIFQEYEPARLFAKETAMALGRNKPVLMINRYPNLYCPKADRFEVVSDPQEMCSKVKASMLDKQSVHSSRFTVGWYERVPTHQYWGPDIVEYRGDRKTNILQRIAEAYPEMQRSACFYRILK
jgi:hypothetical protein